MEDPAAFVLTQAAEADFPTEYGLFRIYGFEGRTGDRVEEAVVLKWATFIAARRRCCGSIRNA